MDSSSRRESNSSSLSSNFLMYHEYSCAQNASVLFVVATKRKRKNNFYLEENCFSFSFIKLSHRRKWGIKYFRIYPLPPTDCSRIVSSKKVVKVISTCSNDSVSSGKIEESALADKLRGTHTASAPARTGTEEEISDGKKRKRERKKERIDALYRRQNTTIEYDGRVALYVSNPETFFPDQPSKEKGGLVQARRKIEQSCDTWEIHALPVPLVQFLASALRRTRHFGSALTKKSLLLPRSPNGSIRRPPIHRGRVFDGLMTNVPELKAPFDVLTISNQ